MDDLLRRIGSESGLVIMVALAMLVVAIPVVLWRLRSGQRLRPAAWKTGLEAAIVGSVAVIVALTLGSFATGGQGQVSWVPFQGLFDSFSLGEFWVGLALTDLVGNFLLLVPLGFFVGLRLAGISGWVWAPAVVALTVAIEVVQFLVLNRSADVTDVATNSLGGITGFAAARLLQRVGRSANARAPA